MKKLLLTLLTIAASACSPSPGPIHIENVQYAQSNCQGQLDPQFYLPRGNLDIAAGTPEFWVDVLVGGAETVVTAPVNAMNGTTITLEPGNREAVVIDQVVLNYQTVPRIPGFKTETMSYLSARAKNRLSVMFDALGPVAKSVLENNIEASNAPTDTIELKISMELRGYVDGSGSRITTGVVTLPVTVYKSIQPSCANGYVRYPQSECGGVRCCTYVGVTNEAPQCKP